MTWHLPSPFRPRPPRKLGTPDPLDHPDLARLDPAALADLPRPRK